MKIHYLDKSEITLRTDCQAIISFYNKTANNKPSRVRWIKFTDFVTGTGVHINFEHIDGKHNTLADTLSRLTTYCTTRCLNPEQTAFISMLEPVLEEIQTGMLNDASTMLLCTRIQTVFPCTQPQTSMTYTTRGNAMVDQSQMLQSTEASCVKSKNFKQGWPLHKSMY